MYDSVGHRNSSYIKEGNGGTSTKRRTIDGADHQLSKSVQTLSSPLMCMQVNVYKLSRISQRNTFRIVVCDKFEHTAKDQK